MTQKYLHLSDILTFYTGAIVSVTDELTAPDGTVKPKYETKMQPVLFVAEFISGKQLWIDKKTKEYDGFELARSVDNIKDNLLQQLPWLKDYSRIPELPAGTSQEEKEMLLKDWVTTVAEKHGGEWFKLESGFAKPSQDVIASLKKFAEGEGQPDPVSGKLIKFPKPPKF